MAIGSTVEGFDIHPGDKVWVAKLVSIKQPILRKATPTDADPKAFTDVEQPAKNLYKPQELIATERLVDPSWKRYGDCFVHCEQLNRAKRD